MRPARPRSPPLVYHSDSLGARGLKRSVLKASSLLFGVEARGVPPPTHTHSGWFSATPGRRPRRLPSFFLAFPWEVACVLGEVCRDMLGRRQSAPVVMISRQEKWSMAACQLTGFAGCDLLSRSDGLGRGWEPRLACQGPATRQSPPFPPALPPSRPPPILRHPIPRASAPEAPRGSRHDAAAPPAPGPGTQRPGRRGSQAPGPEAASLPPGLWPGPAAAAAAAGPVESWT